MMANPQNAAFTEDDDSFMDWETRDESVSFWKHCVAGT